MGALGGTAQHGLSNSRAVPIALLREQAERQAIIDALADASCDTIWLKVENFGDAATGEKTAAYLDACRDFHIRGLPLNGDHIGGLPGLGALALGAVGGIAHGVTMQQSFPAASWRRPRPEGDGGEPGWRVYIPQLDLVLKRRVAKDLFEISTRSERCAGAVIRIVVRLAHGI